MPYCMQKDLNVELVLTFQMFMAVYILLCVYFYQLSFSELFLHLDDLSPYDGFAI